MRFTWHLCLISQALTINVASTMPLPSDTLSAMTASPKTTPDSTATSTQLSSSDLIVWNLRRSFRESPSMGSVIGMPFRTPLQLEHEAQTRSAGELPARTAALLLETSRSDVVSGLDSLDTRTVQRLADAARRLKARVDASIPLEHLVGVSNSTITKRDAMVGSRASVRKRGSLVARLVEIVRGTSM